MKTANKCIFKPKSKYKILEEIKYSSPVSLLFKSVRYSFIYGIEIALEQGADIHTNNDQALKLSCTNDNYEIVKLLLESGANIHAGNDYVLRWSANYGHEKVVKLLIKKGANVHAQDNDALRWSYVHGHEKVTKILLKAGSILEDPY